MAKRALLLSCCLLLTGMSVLAWAQAGSVAAVNSEKVPLFYDAASERAQVVAFNMRLSAEQSTVFWPVYENYEQERCRLMEEWKFLLAQYAKISPELTNKEAASIFKRMTTLQQKQFKLETRYYRRFEKATDAIVAMRFFQIDRMLSSLARVRMMREYALVDDTACQ